MTPTQMAIVHYTKNILWRKQMKKKTQKKTKQVVINTCFGGFSLSLEALEALIKMKSNAVEVMTEEEYWGKGHGALTDEYKKQNAEWVSMVYRDGKVFGLKDNFNSKKEIREHKDLVKIVKTLGKKANGPYSELKIIKIPADVKYTIESYDGDEWIAEVHRIWH
jgi:hypothetical protein